MVSFERLNRNRDMYEMPISSLGSFNKFYPVVTWCGQHITQAEMDDQVNSKYPIEGYSTYAEAYKVLQKIKFDSFDNGICVHDGEKWIRIHDVDYRREIIVIRSIP